MNTALRFALVLVPALTACSGAHDPTAGEGDDASLGITDPTADAPSNPNAMAGKKLRHDFRTGLVLPGPSYYPEGIAVSGDGTFYVGSIGTGAIVRFSPGATESEGFLPARSAFGVYGMAVDEDRDLLWACTYDDLLYPAQPAYLKAYDLATGAEAQSYVMPGESGFCNDLILDDDGNVYATDAIASTIVRLPAGGAALETWSADPAYADPNGFTVNGIVYDEDDDRLYVVKYVTGELFSVPIQPDGSAGAAEAIAVSPPLEFPDGVELLPGGALLVVENDVGRVSVVTLSGGAGQKTVVAEGLAEPTTAAIHNRSAWVVEGQLSLLFNGGDPSLPFHVKRVPTP